MKLSWVWLGLIALGVAVGTAHAQQPPTTVQLPTFSAFTGSTTVSVPDRGRVYMGGVKRAASGRNEFGVPMLPFRPFRNNAIGSRRSASSLYVTATIHDFEAMDEFLLNQPTPFRSLQASAARQGPDTLPAIAAAGPASPRLGISPQEGTAVHERPLAGGNSWTAVVPDAGGRAKMSLAQAQALRQSRSAARNAEAETFLLRGRKAEATHKIGVAKIYYQMAARRATGDLRSQVAARLTAIGRVETGGQVAQSRP